MVLLVSWLGETEREIARVRGRGEEAERRRGGEGEQGRNLARSGERTGGSGERTGGSGEGRGEE
jgi:hypothetical protein